MSNGLHIIKAEKHHVSIILTMILELAEYEKLKHEVVATEEQLLLSLFGERAYAEVLLAYYDEKPIGFALFFHNFSTFLAKPGLYLEDLYIKPDYRGKGFGKVLLGTLAQIALERDCGRLEWWVLDWNASAIAFYRRIGAIAMDEWTVQRVSGKALDQLAQSSIALQE